MLYHFTRSLHGLPPERPGACQKCRLHILAIKVIVSQEELTDFTVFKTFF
jgi:hypothetical protein